jgi:hypothetical protein
MKTTDHFPSFDEHLPYLDQFIHTLVSEYKNGNINSWNDLDLRVKAFFTLEVMNSTSLVVPHWGKMASYVEGVTLTHVMCVFLGMYMMPEFLEMTHEQQQMMKWVILFHDVEKEPKPGIRDHTHAFRSAVGASKTLHGIGFPIIPEYKSVIDEWSEFTLLASTTLGDPPIVVQDNSKLPNILDGIEHMFGHNTPATLIIKTILFHLSVDMNDWPPPNPLTEEEVIRYFDRELLPLLEVMNLADGDGWALFNPESRERQRIDTIRVFKRLTHLLSR